MADAMDPAAVPVPLLDEERIEYIEASRQEMALNCTLTGFLFALLIVFVLFSTTITRKTFLFWWLVGCAIATIIQGILMAIEANVLFLATQSQESLSLQISTMILTDWLPLFIDASLIFKLLAFYPRSSASNNKRLAVVAFPVLVKIPRLICLMYVVITYFAKPSIFKSYLLVVEWSLQLADITYCCAFLIWKLSNLRAAFHRQHPNSTNTAGLRNTSRVRSQLQFLIESICCAFMLPCLTCALQIGLYYTHPESFGPIVNCHVYLSCIGALLATVWSSIRDQTSRRTLFLNGSSNASSEKGSGGDPLRSPGYRRQAESPSRSETTRTLLDQIFSDPMHDIETQQTEPMEMLMTNPSVNEEAASSTMKLRNVRRNSATPNGAPTQLRKVEPYESSKTLAGTSRSNSVERSSDE
ncbi:hypothetical protein IE81DRAFT_347113 [Ceraceosorus guamensis]|uniref:STE3-domain-containing protein n=1 Tax=Ceraceosorus guamensis TaxID=1522189 RepID=A0A316VZ81_9BASI|nr:hypothetical protein IE81DRAFT_347113 [Ceraceosorus guamensis]PWN42739.1 hypothetical protein IE81DRAFT_347113 [Ceraceosorus guamensis]